jgi:hypothetical protein
MSNDPFDPKNLRLPNHARASVQAEPKLTKRQPTEPKEFELKFYKIPKWVVDRLLGISPYNGVAFIIIYRLYELWFTNYHKNPVELSNAYFRKFGVSAHSKLLALEILVKTGVVTETKRGQKCPLVTMNWLPLHS